MDIVELVSQLPIIVLVLSAIFWLLKIVLLFHTHLRRRKRMISNSKADWHLSFKFTIGQKHNENESG